ncbi:MAG: hypothetical protein LBK08_09330 [Treponema sp.]|jgi:hypothetical protein|nr:hypothetical protein [Treponema sp.]
MKNKVFTAVIIGVVLVCGLVLAGCDNGNTPSFADLIYPNGSYSGDGDATLTLGLDGSMTVVPAPFASAEEQFQASQTGWINPGTLTFVASARNIVVTGDVWNGTGFASQSQVGPFSIYVQDQWRNTITIAGLSGPFASLNGTWVRSVE